MVRPDDIVVVSRRKQCRRLREGRRLNRRQLFDVEVRAGEDVLANLLEGPSPYEAGQCQWPAALHHLLRHAQEAGEGRVHDVACDVRVAGGVQCSRRSPHRPAPDADRTHLATGTQVLDHSPQVLLLIVPERDVLASGPAGTGQVQAEHSDVPRQQVRQDIVSLKPRRAVPVEVHDTGQSLRRLLEAARLEVAALQRLASVVPELQVRAHEAAALDAELRGAELRELILEPRRPDDDIGQARQPAKPEVAHGFRPWGSPRAQHSATS
mmetsp:Transcript_70098/g.180683  ORF Transcript_70098/g.180683 Transcript_70098/m.180683 type:complete len:267 (+) Transcript_70098:514-1314(+)